MKLYVIDGCLQCEQACKLLEGLRIPYTKTRIGIDTTMRNVADMFPGAMELPIVVTADNWLKQPIIGYNQLLQHLIDHDLHK